MDAWDILAAMLQDRNFFQVNDIQAVVEDFEYEVGLQVKWKHDHGRVYKIELVIY